MTSPVRKLGCVLSGALAIAGLSVISQASGSAVPSPKLTVEPTSGPVGSVVTVHASTLCGQIEFGRFGGTSGGTALGDGPTVRFVIPSFVGVPATPVTIGLYAFGMSCGPNPSSTMANVKVTFLVTGAAVPTRFVGLAHTPDGQGYWLAQANGGVESFGSAQFFGSLPGLGLVPSAPVVGIAASNDGKGYWLVGGDGGVFAFGDAKYVGSLPSLGVTPTDPIVGMAATHDSAGYWLLGADGGVFALGNAPYCAPQSLNAAVFHLGLQGPTLWAGVSAYTGSVGFVVVNTQGAGVVAPLPGQSCQAAPTPNPDTGGVMNPQPFGLIAGATVSEGNGNLWLVGNDGGVFAPQVVPFSGNGPTVQAPYFGSLPGLGIAPHAPIVAISSTPDGHGYWLLGADGGVFAFGDAPFLGSAA